MPKYSLENIKNSSVYITPNFPVISTKRYKFSFLKSLGFIFLYTLFFILLTASIVLFTPLREIALFLEEDKFLEQKEQITQLEDKIVYLQKELESIVSISKKLKFAMLLGATDSLDSSAAVYDSLKTFDEEIPKEGGSILVAFKQFINKFFPDSSDKNLFFRSPVNAFVNNKFNPSKGHFGLDFAAKNGSPIYASAGGLVLVSTYSDADGYWLMIKHDDNFISIYKHCSSLLKKVRQYVSQGEVIALSGNSGVNTTGPHLHFEIWQDGKAIDPEKVLYNSKE